MNDNAFAVRCKTGKTCRQVSIGNLRSVHVFLRPCNYMTIVLWTVVYFLCSLRKFSYFAERLHRARCYIAPPSRSRYTYSEPLLSEANRVQYLSVGEAVIVKSFLVFTFSTTIMQPKSLVIRWRNWVVFF